MSVVNKTAAFCFTIQEPHRATITLSCDGDIGNEVFVCDLSNDNVNCFFLLLQDIDPPIILGCPDDIVRTANPSGECVRVFWMVPVAIDVVSGIPLVVNNFDPGFCFGIGVTTVVYTFSDASGNEASCQFNVRIGQGGKFICFKQVAMPPIVREF